GWIDGCNRVKEYQGELTRRRQACDLFLQWVSSGQISAFALTEPSAGSDTVRLATRAKLRSVPVEEQADGSFRFIPAGAPSPSPLPREGEGKSERAGGKEHRVVLDAQRLEFRDRKPYYRWSGAETVPLCFDEYDYET